MKLTPEEGRRRHVLTLLEGQRISVGQAAKALGLSPRQVRRLRVRLRRDGPAALSHGNRGRRSGRRLPELLRAQILTLAQGRYVGYERSVGRRSPRQPSGLASTTGRSAVNPRPVHPHPLRRGKRGIEAVKQ